MKCSFKALVGRKSYFLKPYKILEYREDKSISCEANRQASVTQIALEIHARSEHEKIAKAITTYRNSQVQSTTVPTVTIH
jgi:hypothetical protein